ncbi:MAG: plastocyanin/azurin family copper-binding protein [Longimicrobiales bacterium]
MIKSYRVAAGVALLILAACATESDGSAGEDGSKQETIAPVESHEGILVIRMSDDMAFDPERAVINVGDTVVWIQEGVLPHTTSDGPGKAAVPDHALLPEGAEPWDSGLLDPGQRFSVVFDTPGEYTYLCTIHEAAGMVGRISVR